MPDDCTTYSRSNAISFGNSPSSMSPMWYTEISVEEPQGQALEWIVKSHN